MGIPAVGALPFACVISEFTRPNGNALDQIRNDGLSRRHLFFTFLVNISRDHFLWLSSYGLAVSAADHGDFAIVSGQLSVWVNAVVELTRNEQLRKFGCALLAWFERESLGEAWALWEKKHLPQGLYMLEKK